MGAKNVTLSIDEELLHEARVVAAHRRTTVSALVRSHLRALVDQERERQAAWQSIRAMVEAPHLEVGPALPTRDEVHHRAG
jgi:Arc/MetJ-type ribon-helix-helix transcriptional regulator